MFKKYRLIPGGFMENIMIKCWVAHAIEKYPLNIGTNPHIPPKYPEMAPNGGGHTAIFLLWGGYHGKI